MEQLDNFEIESWTVWIGQKSITKTNPQASCLSFWFCFAGCAITDDKKQDYYRHHYVSGLTLLNVDENDRENWSYVDLADQMRRWIVNPSSDLYEMFKRIVFSGLVLNAEAFDLSKEDAKAIYENLKSTISNWRSFSLLAD